MQHYVSLLPWARIPRALFSVRLLPLLGLLVVLALTPYAAMSRSLWTDEAYSVSYTFHPTLGAVLEDVRKNEETPPLYFMALWLWARMSGHSELALRSFSLISGALAVMAFTTMARRLAPAATLLGLMVLAVSPLLRQYLVEVRGYSLMVLFGTLCVAAFERLYRTPDSLRAQLIYAGSAIALFLTSYFSVALLIVHGCALFWQLRAPETRVRRLVSLLLMLLSCILATAWWLPSLIYQMRIAPAVTASWSQGYGDYYMMALSLFAGVAPWGQRFVLWQAAAAAGVMLAIAACNHPRVELRGLVLRTFFLPLALLLVIALYMEVSASRYMILASPGAALAVAIGFEALQRRKVLACLCVGLLIGGALVLNITQSPAATGNQWADLSAVVAAEASASNDAVILQPPWNQRVLEYYYDGPVVEMVGAHHYDDFYVHEGQPFSESWSTSQLLPRIAGSRRVWLVVDGDYRVGSGIDLPYEQVSRRRFGQLELLLYMVPAP